MVAGNQLVVAGGVVEGVEFPLRLLHREAVGLRIAVGRGQPERTLAVGVLAERALVAVLYCGITLITHPVRREAATRPDHGLPAGQLLGRRAPRRHCCRSRARER